MVIKMTEVALRTKYGVFKEVLFYDGQSESAALIMGNVKDEKDVLCRIHSSCLHAHAFNSIECDCREQMAKSQELIQRRGQGIIIWLDQEGKGNGHYALLKSIPFKRQGIPQAEAYVKAGFRKDRRDFRAAAEIIKFFDIASIRLLTNNVKKVEELKELDIDVLGILPRR